MMNHHGFQYIFFRADFGLIDWLAKNIPYSTVKNAPQ